jgi:hypothetical protein
LENHGAGRGYKKIAKGVVMEKKVIAPSGSALDRREFVKRAGFAGLGAAAITFLGGAASKLAASPAPRPGGRPSPASFPSLIGASSSSNADTAQEIFTAALVAEDLAVTMYYNSLIGGVIQDPNLAGPGGTATKLGPGGQADNVAYLRAALNEEFTHGNLLRSLIGGTNFSGDPFQTFYFPDGTFDTLAGFIPILLAAENAFIGAYLTAVKELGNMAVETQAGTVLQLGPDGTPYTTAQLTYYAEVAASIMGVECEHRVLGRTIPGLATFQGISLIPADDLNYEQTDGLNAVFNGSHSAVAALTPFLTPSTGPAFSLATAQENLSSVVLHTHGGLPHA